MRFDKPHNQKKFICIRSNAFCKAGQWLIAEEVGEPLYRARIFGGPRGVTLTQTDLVAIPFEALAAYIVEFGFEVPQSFIRAMQRPSLQHEVKSVEDFQRSVEDIIEPELQSRNETANPSYASKSGIVVPRGYVEKGDGT